MAQTRAQLRAHTVCGRCSACGMIQMRDFNNECMYCGGKKFTIVIDEGEEFSEKYLF